MYNEPLNNMNLKEVHDLIDLYKYASIEGEKVEFSVKSTKDNVRIITIEIQNGHPRDKDTFVFKDGDYFDDIIFPELLSYFSCDDPLGKWDVTKSKIEEEITVGYNETQSGDSVYAETRKDNLFEELENKIEKAKEETTYKRQPLSNEDKIWDEIILYAKGRRVTQDFFIGSDLMDEEIERVYELIKNLSEEKEINIGTSKKARENNEKFLTDLLKDRSKVREYAKLYDATIDSINNPGTIKKLAQLVGAEKRIRKRLDLENEEVFSRIVFAVSELDKVNFYDLRNANIKQFKDETFIESKPKAVKSLMKIFENSEAYSPAKKEQYNAYCEELLKYLEKKSNNNRKVIKSSINFDEVIFTDHTEGKEEVVSLNKETESAVEETKETKTVSEGDLNRLLDEMNQIMLEREKQEKEAEAAKKIEEEKDKEETKETVSVDSKKTPDVEEVKDTPGDKTKEEITTTEPEKKEEKLIDASEEAIIEKYDPEDKNKIRDLIEEIRRQAKENRRKKIISNELIPVGEDVEIYDEETIERMIKARHFNGKYTDDSISKPKHGKTDEEVTKEKKDDEEVSKDVSTTTSTKETTPTVTEEKTSTVSKDGKIRQIFVDNLNLATFEIIVDKYKDNLDIHRLTPNEQEAYNSVIAKKEELEKYYNDNFDKINSMTKEELKEFADCEVYLMHIYNIENKYANKEKKNYRENISPSRKLLLKTMKESNEVPTELLIEEIVDYNMKKYIEYADKYYKKEWTASREEIIKDREEFKKLYIYKMTMIDAYNALMFKKDDLSEEELKQLAYYETVLKKMYEIEASYQENKEIILDELLKKQEFILPSTRIWLSALRNELAKNDSLFEVVEQEKEEKIPEKVVEIQEAYDKALSYSTKDSPAMIRVHFEKDNKESASVTISNKIKGQDIIIFRREYKIDELESLVMPTLRDVYTNDNNINYNIKFNIAGTTDAGLLAIGDDHKSFNIDNATEEFVDLNKQELEVLINKKALEKFKNKQEAIKK